MSSQISISEAARRWNLSRTTIYKAMNNGELSTTGKGKSRKVDVSEMIRVYGDVQLNSFENSNMNSSEHIQKTIIEQLISSKDEVIRQKQDEIDWLKSELEKRDIREQKLVEHQTKSLWKKIFG